MLFALLMVVFVIVCLFLILMVIIQSDKGGGISGAIGGSLGGANAFLGTQDTANILTRATTGAAITFMVLCILLSLVLSHSAKNVQKSELSKRAETQQNFSPASALGGGALPLKPAEQGEATPGAQGNPVQLPSGLPVKSPE